MQKSILAPPPTKSAEFEVNIGAKVRKKLKQNICYCEEATKASEFFYRFHPKNNTVFSCTF